MTDPSVGSLVERLNEAASTMQSDPYFGGNTHLIGLLREAASRLASPEGTRVKCDGNHAGPRCADPECWNDTASPADTSGPANELIRLGERAALWFADGERTDELLDEATAIKCIDGALGALECLSAEKPNERLAEKPNNGVSAASRPAQTCATCKWFSDGRCQDQRMFGETMVYDNPMKGYRVWNPVEFGCTLHQRGDFNINATPAPGPTVRDVEEVYSVSAAERPARCSKHPQNPCVYVCVECFESDRVADANERAAHAETALTAASRPAQTWQPIESAPKDRTIIGALIRDGKVWRVHEMKHNGIAFYTTNGGSLPQMTHWIEIPLPAPPGPVAQENT